MLLDVVLEALHSHGEHQLEAAEAVTTARSRLRPAVVGGGSESSAVQAREQRGPGSGRWRLRAAVQRGLVVPPPQTADSPRVIVTISLNFGCQQEC